MCFLWFKAHDLGFIKAGCYYTLFYIVYALRTMLKNLLDKFYAAFNWYHNVLHFVVCLACY